MASTTIHTLSYKMVADTSNFTKGMLATKSQTQLLKKILGDTTAEQKAANALTNLNKLFDAGKVSAAQYAKAKQDIARELTSIHRAASPVWKTLDKVNASLRSIGKAGLMAAGAAGAAGVGILGYNVKKEIANIKDLADAAEDLQIPFNDLVRVQQAFIRGGEVSGDTVVPALRTMQQNIQLSARDMGKFKKLAGELGLEMDSMFALSKMPVLEQFRTVVQQISTLPDQGSKGLIVAKLFGTDDSKLTTLLGGGLDNLNKIAATADELGLTLKNDSVTAISEMVGQTEKLQDTWTGLIRKLAVELTPWLDKMVQVLQFVNNTLGGKNGAAGLTPSVSGMPGRDIVRAAEAMAATEQVGMGQFANNRGKFVTQVRGRLNADSLVNFFQQARQFDPNFSDYSLRTDQREALNRSALKGNPGGTQEQVQLEILNELKKQVAASQELVRVELDRQAQRRGLIE